MKNQEKSFSYTYSARQQEEITHIRQKYIPCEENKMEQLRRLDKSVTKLGTIVSIIIGIISTLILGLGMTCTMVWKDYFIPGIIIGVVGIIGISLAYPAFKIITKKQHEKLAPQIINLTDELMQKK